MTNSVIREPLSLNNFLFRLRSILAAFRPKTLTAALVPCVAGSGYSWAKFGSFHFEILALALLSSFFIQIGTNLVNDAVDFKKGADNEKRIGPQRITQAGLLSPSAVMALATFFFILSIVCGIPLVLEGGTIVIIIGLLSVLMGYAYTAGPFPLAYLGLGDVFVILFFGLVAVMGMSFLQSHHWTLESAILGFQIGMHATVLIAVNNLRDSAGDAQVGKKTLAVRFGKKFSRYEISFLLFAPFFLNLYWLFQGVHWSLLLSYLVLPLAIKVSKNIFKNEPGPIYNRYLGQSAGVHLLFGLLTALGFFLS